MKSHPQEAKSITVPCIIYDGRSENFAAEMFVIINSTPTRINKSHLIDLYERVSWSAPDRRLAARIVDMLYQQSDSPLQYKINRLGGRSRQEKWILQAELYNEIHRMILSHWPNIEANANNHTAETYYTYLRDLLKSAAHVFEDAWGNPNFMVTHPVTLKAIIRVGGDLIASDAAPSQGRQNRWQERLLPWRNEIRYFRRDGFHDRFAARGSVERVRRIYQDLTRWAGVCRAKDLQNQG
jgi:DGQHR domain-containing protein